MVKINYKQAKQEVVSFIEHTLSLLSEEKYDNSYMSGIICMSRK
ncbi:hypothetical protein [Hungatella hathewayi]